MCELDFQNELAAKGIKIERGNDEVTVVCDAVVIGSGAGGGTAAALLSDAGKISQKLFSLLGFLELC